MQVGKGEQEKGNMDKQDGQDVDYLSRPSM